MAGDRYFPFRQANHFDGTIICCVGLNLVEILKFYLGSLSKWRHIHWVVKPHLTCSMDLSKHW